MSRALLEAELFADYREAYGRKIKAFPSVARGWPSFPSPASSLVARGVVLRWRVSAERSLSCLAAKLRKICTSSPDFSRAQT